MKTTAISQISGLVRNRVTEKDVREHLNQQGFSGNNARFDYLELFAIERPGWNQIFTFCVDTTDQAGMPTRLHGVFQDDERRSSQIYFGDSEEEQSRVAKAWSEGLITSRREPLGAVQRWLLVAFGLLAMLVLLGIVLSDG